MQHRIFIAINLPENIKTRLREFQSRFSGWPVRWTKEVSLHLTLVFIGSVSGQQLVETCQAVRTAASKYQPFFIDFQRIVLGPPGWLERGTPPRFIWVEGGVSRQLTDLKREVETVLLSVNAGLVSGEARPFKPHITLARIPPEKWQRMASQPLMDKEFLAQWQVTSVEVMESDLKRDGAEYIVLESMILGNLTENKGY